MDGVLFNGTVADEVAVFHACMEHLNIGKRQVLQPMTDLGYVTVEEMIDRHWFGTLTSYFRKVHPWQSEEVRRDFVAKNQEPYPVDPEFIAGSQLVCWTPEIGRTIIENRSSGWAGFVRQWESHSLGTLTLSRVGLNRAATQAIMYLGHQWGPRAGHGGCYACALIGREWRVVGERGLWIS